MITLRHHVISLVAVFLALAVGVILGSGPLSDVADRTTPTASTPANATAADPQVSYGDNFAAAVGPELVSGKLSEQQVALVTAPGADEEVVTALGEQITAAGATIAGRYALTDAMLDPSQKSLVDTLGSQLMTQQPEDVSAQATTYDRMGQLLGLSLATKTQQAANVNGKARALIEAISGADLMAPAGAADKRAPLVLFVLGPDARDDGVDAIIAGLLAGIAQQATGVVATGTTADGGEGQVGRFRADPAAAGVATVDGVETAAGRITAVLALAKVLGAPGGSFGASGSDGAAPLG